MKWEKLGDDTNIPSCYRGAIGEAIDSAKLAFVLNKIVFIPSDETIARVVVAALETLFAAVPEPDQEDEEDYDEFDDEEDNDLYD